jgi:uncharacterized protein YjiS (DUF1127 family)
MNVWPKVTGYFRDTGQRAEHRRAAAALLSLDEHLLRDLGVRRRDVERLVREGRG